MERKWPEVRKLSEPRPLFPLAVSLYLLFSRDCDWLSPVRYPFLIQPCMVKRTIHLLQMWGGGPVVTKGDLSYGLERYPPNESTSNKYEKLIKDVCVYLHTYMQIHKYIYVWFKYEIHIKQWILTLKRICRSNIKMIKYGRFMIWSRDLVIIFTSLCPNLEIYLAPTRYLVNINWIYQFSLIMIKIKWY